jgi:alkylation response protein AidB-like acyl-CoA dehydrogenase
MGDHVSAIDHGDDRQVVDTLCDTVDRWAARHIDARAIDRAGRIPPQVLAALAELGLFGLPIPGSYGGGGLPLAAVCRVISTLARHDRSVATTVGLHVGLGTRPLVAFGGEALCARHLPLLAAGKRIAAFAATESEAGSDLSAIRTTATRTDAERIRIEGEKIYVTNGALASVFTVVAATPSMGGASRGHSLILVERDDRGVAIGNEEHKLGLRGSSTTPLRLDGVEVGTDRVIGLAGAGMRHLRHVLSWGRTVMAAGCVGAAETALSFAVEHVTTRRQFGRPLAQLEVVREQIATMAALTRAMSAIVAQTAAVEEDHEALAVRSTSAKVFCSEAAWEVADLAVQLHGGAGFIEETGLPLVLRDARITRIFEGANDVLCAHLGAMELTSPPARRIVGDPDADHLAARIGERRRELLDLHGIRILSRQRLLHGLGRLVVLREACDAAAAGARTDGTPEARRLAAAFIDLAGRRAAAFLEDPPPIAQTIAISDAAYARPRP